MNVSNTLATFDPMAAHMVDLFGLGVHPEDLISSRGMRSMMSPSMMCTGYNRPWAMIPRRDKIMLDENAPVTKMTTTKDGTFQVCVDVHHFKPKEIHVKTIDNQIIIEGKHEERADNHGFIERRFVRKYTLPENYDIEHVVSNLSSDGILTVKAPPPMPATEGKKHRVVPVHHTGPAHLTIKDHDKQDEKK